jgi:hypothetical protein
VIETAFRAAIPPVQQDHVTAVLEKDTTKLMAYRAKLVLQLAYGVAASTPVTLTARQPGARTVAGKLGALLRKKHVRSPDNVDQNRGGAAALGHCPGYDEFLAWASEPGRTTPELQATLDYVCLQVARAARPVKQLPRIDNQKLTFAAVMSLLRELLAVPSRGAYQQFVVAALLTGRVKQERPRQHVETKAVTATDESSRTAADVRVKSGDRVEEAYEVTANDWTTKLTEAETKIREHDLPRLHIVAQVTDVPGMIDQLQRRSFDISALDLTAFISVLVAELRPESRNVALVRLYDLLDRFQSDTELVNRYVDLLVQHGLTLQ